MILEAGLVGGPTSGWGAARAASRWVRISGMTCSVLPTRDSQPHWQLARRWPLLARPAGLTLTLCPGTCSLTEMVTVTSDRSVRPNVPTWEAGHQIAARVEDVVGRGRLDTARHARLKIATPPVPTGQASGPRSVTDGRSAVRQATQQTATQFCGIAAARFGHGWAELAQRGLHSARQPDQETASLSRFAWRSQFVEHLAFLSGPTFTGRSVVQRRILVVLALVGCCRLSWSRMPGPPPRPPAGSAPARSPAPTARPHRG